MRIGRILIGAALVFGALGTAATAGHAATSGPRTFFSYQSDPAPSDHPDWREFIGQGGHNTFVPGVADGKFTSFGWSGNAGHINVTLNVSNSDEQLLDFWTIDVAAPKHQSLKAGRTYTVKRWPFQGNDSAGLAVFGNGRGCDTLTGTVTINAIDFDRIGLRKLDLTYVQFCDGSALALRGGVRITR